MRMLTPTALTHLAPTRACPVELVVGDAHSLPQRVNTNTVKERKQQ